MYRFGKRSKAEMATIEEDLQKILNRAIKVVDFSVREGHRNKAKQDGYFASGKSKLKFPEGKHNCFPSEAVDIAPSPYPKTDAGIKQAYFLAGIIKGIAVEMGIDIIIGCDWNNDGDIRNDNFQDVWHIELI